MAFNSAFGSPGNDFLQNYMQSKQNSGKPDSFMDRPDLIAANVLVPDMNPDGSFKMSENFYTKKPETNFYNVRKDYPQLPVQREGDVGGENPYRALGIFGGLGADPTDTQSRGFIRGSMQFVPGGIPASPGFNYDETLKQYPEQMKGIPKGNMPVYGSPY